MCALIPFTNTTLRFVYMGGGGWQWVPPPFLLHLIEYIEAIFIELIQCALSSTLMYLIHVYFPTLAIFKA